MKASSPRLKLRQADVFTIPLSETEVGFGQIVNFPVSQHVFMICVFDHTASVTEAFDIEDICNSAVVFFGSTTDAKLYHGDWILVGNHSASTSRLEMPYFKLGTAGGDMRLVDYQGKVLGAINENAFEQLEYKWSCSPIRFENALKAYRGLSEWDEAYDKLLYSRTLASVDIFHGLRM